jgi:hypothetical protein
MQGRPLERVDEPRDRSWGRLEDPAALAWFALVAAAFIGATFVRSQVGPFGPDHMMSLAHNILTEGRFDLHFDQLTTSNDIVTLDGRYYQAMSLLPTVPYFVFVPFQFLWPFSRWIVSACLGIFAACLALPVARRYGPGGSADWWLAALGAFGMLIFTLSIEGDFYYLAHLESIALTFLALIEWHDRRRAWVIGLLIGLAGLARPTLFILAVPFGLMFLWESSNRLRTAIAFSIPILAAVAVTGAFDFVRFGSPLETGYDIAWVEPDLALLRAQGLFSTTHLPGNLALFLGGGYTVIDRFPWLQPSTLGQSIFLTTPAVLIAFNASLRDRTNLLLWASVVLTAIPVFLYYGGGGAATYGYRYALDFMPFLFALTAVALRNRFDNLEKVLIALSVAFCSYSYVWEIYK